MKKTLFLLLAILSLTASAQTIPSYPTIKLTKTTEGTIADSLVVINGTVLKHLPTSKLGTVKSVTGTDGITVAAGTTTPVIGISSISQLKVDGLVTDLGNKVDKVTGKSLLSDTEISRLLGLSNYTHPANHPPNIITQDTSNRFVTDAEKATWNAKVSGSGFNNYIPKFNSSNNLTYSLISEPGNGLVDIGAGLSVNGTLAVNGNGTFNGFLVSSAAINADQVVIKSQLDQKQASLGYTPENAANKNIASGYAGLGTDGKLLSAQLPDITISDTFVTASQAAMLALTAQTGDVSVRTDLNKSFILKGVDSSVLADWQELLTPTSAVTTVFGRNGGITTQSGDYNADQITETASRVFQTPTQRTNNDATSSIQTQLNGKQASGSYETAFTKNTAFNKNFGTTTGTVGDGAVVAANTAKVGITTTQANNITANNAKISFDATSSTRLANTSGTNTGDQDISGKANLASPALTGVPLAPTATAGTNTTQIATTAFVLANTTTGPQGIKGDQGIQGLKGDTGAAGTTASSNDFIQNGTTQQTASLNISGTGVFGSSVTAASFKTTTDIGIDINGIALTKVAANSAIRVDDGLETLGLLRSYAGLNVATTGIFGSSVTTTKLSVFNLLGTTQPLLELGETGYIASDFGSILESNANTGKFSLFNYNNSVKDNASVLSWSRVDKSISFGGAATFSSSVTAAGVNLTGTFPSFSITPTAWASTFFLQSGIDLASNSAGDYTAFQNPAAKGFQFKRGGVSDLIISPTGTATFSSRIQASTLGVNTATNENGWIVDLNGIVALGGDKGNGRLYISTAGTTSGATTLQARNLSVATPLNYSASSHNFDTAATFSSSVTAASHITTGGLATQFVKGDGSLSTTIPDSRPYKCYVALLTQTGTAAPVATILENTTAAVITWGYSSPGGFTGTSTGLFTASKTAVLFTNGYDRNGRYDAARISNNIVFLTSSEATTNSPSNDLINNASIEIRVYN
jgi:hypothetical protein